MRHIGSLNDEQSAGRFGAYLQTKSIKASIDPEGDEWAVWIYNEDLLDVAKDELKQFKADPNAARYSAAVAEAERLEKAVAKKAKKNRKQVVYARDQFNRPASAECPVTFGLIAFSVVVVLFTKDWDAVNRGGSLWDLADREFPVLDRLWIASRFSFAGQWIWDPAEPLKQVFSGQVWRLVTPIFIHMSPLHLLFNMMWMQRLGIAIEFNLGKWRFIGLVLAIAVISNTVQLVYSGPSFGGMSGVVSGLFGFIWVKSRYDPKSSLYIDPNTVMWMMIFLVVCLTGAFGRIANAAHFGGLFVGMLLAILPVLWCRMK